MFFIHPMWDHEAQRIGKQKCTPCGYALHVVADIIGLLGFLLLICALICLVFNAFALWLVAVALSLGVCSEILYRFSWKLARDKGFHWDYERREASWIERGERMSYKRQS